MNKSTYIYLAAAIAIAGIWHGGERVTSNINALPIQDVPRKTTQSAVFDAKKFAPAMVARSNPSGAPVALNSDVEGAFSTPPQPTAPSGPAPINYADLLRQQFRFDGIANDGIFVGNGFYKVGSKLEFFNVETGTGSVVPVLASVNPNAVVVKLGRETVVFKRAAQ